jgi:hypothetical protein
VRRTRRRVLLSCLATTVLGAAVAVAAPPAVAAPFGFDSLKPAQKAHVSGLLSSELNPQDVSRRARTAGPQDRAGVPPCAARLGANVKVNQNCLNLTDQDLQGRAQSQNETWAAADPGNPDRVIATYNDYRRGDGTCGVSYSGDGGRSWADATTPNGFTRGDAFGGVPREYWQGSGDTSVAWDTRGNAYLSCQVFNRGNGVSPNVDQSSAFYVYRSTGTGGASWNFPGRPVATHDDTAGAGTFLLDKQLLTVDASTTSRFRDRVYVTWTTFDADGTAYIFAANSADYGESFSAPVLVSRNSGLCTNTFGIPTPQGTCNSNQFSQPFTAPDGTLYVTWANYNNPLAGPLDNRNQVLVARSTDGGATFSDPVRAAFFYDLPDCATYQNGADPGRACIPEKGPSTNSIFRASNYPIGAVDPRDPRHVVVTIASYINRNSNETNGCTPAGITPGLTNLFTGVKTGSCNNDVVLTDSRDGAATFAGTTADVRTLPVATSAPGQARTDQFFHNAGFTRDGTLAVSYYDRQYGQDETTGFSDVTVSIAREGAFRHTRATSASMPPPTQFGGTFWGDYAGLALGREAALPVWSDTRPVDLFLCAGTGTPGNPPAVCQAAAPNAAVANDQDVFAAPVGLR